MNVTARAPRAPTLVEALVPVGCLMVFLALAVIDLNHLPEIAVVSSVLRALAAIPYFGDALQASIPVHLPLAAAAAVAALMALRLGWSWREIEESFVQGIMLALGAVLILLVVGVLIGTWIASGIVPLLIVYGLKLLSPDYFLLATCLICGVVSLATGSSWTTAGTVGIAFIGIGTALGIPLPMVAGAIISGAYFGDKMSPLSDTTNLAPAVAGAELFEHVRHMALTTGPSLVLALILYWLLGLGYGGQAASLEAVNVITNGLSAGFNLTPWLLLPPVIVLGLVVMRVPALPAVLLGALMGGAAASIFQGVSFSHVLEISYGGFKSETGQAAVDALLSRGGMESMYGTIGIILCAMCFGGVMERSGMLAAIAGAILRLAKGTGGLIAATLASCIGINLIASDQYLSIVVPGRMYREAYRKAGLHPKNLSRCLEDAGTLTSPLVPWNSCGAYMYATLGVFPLAYLPFAFLNLINPVVSAIYGYTGWTITRVKIENDATSSAPPSEPVH
ncbi:MAG: Na+/H+ antiporter NhaC [Opitutaceae bacterium]|nr:Na+/H+ antiporter NhaC [Opitutaceae bacterium]MBP9913593.1 Na+/H+ antiporter NhaC [Opitutaceae bacterium]